MVRSWAASAVAAGALVALWPGGHAFAHAQLESISPANGEVVDTPPGEVVLTFNEPVSLTGGDARVLDDQAAEVSAPAVQSGITITIPLEPDLADGTYTVTWEVVSADSHRIAGASVFHVGAASSAGLDASTIGGGTDVAWGVRLGAVALSGIGYAATLVAIGAWVFSEFVGRPSVAVAHRLRLSPLIVRSAVLGAGMLVGSVPFRIARVGGGLDALRDNDVLAAGLRGPIGQAVAVTALALIAFTVAVERSLAAWIAGLFALVAVGGFALEGHTRALRLRWAMMSSDVVHLTAGAVWLGGIVALTLAFRRRLDALPLAVLVRRFSGAALVAVGVVAVSGVIMAWIVLPTAGELTSTGYGLALVLKVAFVAVVTALGAFNRWLLVPVVANAAATDPSDSAGACQPRDAPRQLLSRIVIAELTVLLAVVGTTAVLVTRSPVAGSAAAPGGGRAGGPTTTAPLQAASIEMSDGGTVMLSLSPGRVGPNTVTVMLHDVEGRIINPIEAPSVDFTEAALDIGPIRPEVTATYIGEYTMEANLVAGTWDVVVRVRVGDFESVSGSTTVTIE